MKILILLCVLTNLVFAKPYGDPPLPIYNTEMNWEFVQKLSKVQLKSIIKNEPINVQKIFLNSYSYINTPYLWGGNDLLKGIDCSHFTWRIFNKTDLFYTYYATTELLKSYKNYDNLESVSDMQSGDILVYGYYDNTGWHGHVVILVNSEYISYGNNKGLVIGSHGTVGVQFISYPGFPEYIINKTVKLYRILRHKNLF